MKRPRMPRAEFEGHAVAYALLIMRRMDVVSLNHDIIAKWGPKMLLRIKTRAWQHVRANEVTP